MHLLRKLKKFMELQMQIEVVYGDVNKQTLCCINLPENSTAREAILKSGFLSSYPELKLEELTIGIFSKKCSLDTLLHPGDRVEIYRSLIIDPKEARRLRAADRKSNHNKV